MKAAEENRDFIIEGMLKSLKTLSLLADGEDPLAIDTETGKMEPGELVASFANLEVSVNSDVDMYPSPLVTMTQTIKSIQ